MKQETLNKKLIERLENHYGLEKKGLNEWVMKMPKGGFLVVHVVNCVIYIETRKRDYVDRLATRYECRSVKDLDYLLTYSMISPFYHNAPAEIINAIKELNK